MRPPGISVWTTHSLEREPQTKLNDAHRLHQRCDLARGTGIFRANVLDRICAAGCRRQVSRTSAQSTIWNIEVGMVGDVEELSTELHVEGLAHAEVLDQ